MRGVSAPELVPSTEITGSSARRSEGNFRDCAFGRVARAVWRKPDAEIATIAGVSDRAARDYLSGKVPAPAVVLTAIMIEITKRRA